MKTIVSDAAHFKGFPGGLDSKQQQQKKTNCNMGDRDQIPGLGRSPGGGHGSVLQYACWRIPMGRGAWRPTVHGVTKRWTRLSNEAQHSRAHGMFVRERRAGRGEGGRETRDTKGRKESPVLLVRTEQPEMAPSRTAPHMPV